MLARGPFSELPLPPPPRLRRASFAEVATKAESALARRQVSPIMGAREFGLDEDRYLSHGQPSQNSTAASGLNKNLSEF